MTLVNKNHNRSFYVNLILTTFACLVVLLFLASQLRQQIEFSTYEAKSSAIIYLNKNNDDKKVLTDAGFFVALDKNERQTLVDTFGSLVAILAKMNVTWYLDAGSLLGYYRHNSIIPWDDDIDIAMFVDQRHIKNVDFFMKKFARKIRRRAGRNFSTAIVALDYVIKYFMANRTLPIDQITARWPYVDILIYTEILGEATTTPKIFWKPWSTKQYPLDLIFPLQEITFENVKVYAPRKIREYLQVSYGPDLDECTPPIWDHRYHKYRRHPNDTTPTFRINCTKLYRKFTHFFMRRF